MNATPLFLLDTNLISLQSGGGRVVPEALAWLESTDARLAIATPVIFEIQRGVENLWRRGSIDALAIQSWLDRLLETDIMVLGCCQRSARLYARMTAEPALSHLWLPGSSNPKKAPGQDLAIASIAIVRGASIATMNFRDFALIDRYFRLPGIFDPAMNLNVVRPWSPCRRLVTDEELILPSRRAGFVSLGFEVAPWHPGPNRVWTRQASAGCVPCMA